MIYGSSSDPVLVKKIPLKLWNLRTEIEETVRKGLTDGDHFRIKLYKDVFKASAPELIDIPKDQKDGEPEQEGLQEAPVLSEAGQSPFDGPDGDKFLSLLLDPPPIPEDKLLKGQTFLSEINMSSISFFCSQKLIEGQTVVLQIMAPRPFTIIADIKFCREYNMKSRIISENRLPYRVLANFSFKRPGERSLLRDFTRSVEPKIDREKQALAEKPALSVVEEDDDDGDDLFSALSD